MESAGDFSPYLVPLIIFLAGLVITLLLSNSRLRSRQRELIRERKTTRGQLREQVIAGARAKGAEEAQEVKAKFPDYSQEEARDLH